jgi:hypothetical protein
MGCYFGSSLPLIGEAVFGRTFLGVGRGSLESGETRGFFCFGPREFRTIYAFTSDRCLGFEFAYPHLAALPSI